MNDEKTPAQQTPLTLKDYTVKPLFSKRNIDIIMALGLVILSIFGVSGLFFEGLSLGYTLTFNAAVILISAFLIKKGKKISLPFFACGALSLICSWSFLMTSNTAVKLLSLIATGGSAIIWFAFIAGKEYSGGDYGLIVYFVNAVYDALSDIPRVFKGLFSKNENKSKKISNILLGILCALPAVLIIVPILASADYAFSGLVSSIFDDYTTLIQKIVLGLGASVILSSLVFSLKYNGEKHKTRELSVKANNASLSAFLCVVSFVYLVYLFSQLAYFFSAFSSILPDGYKFTYAQYARRGFFELCIISVINLLFIFAAILISEKKDGKVSLAVKLPATFIVLFTFMIICTAISKMVMYIGVYGCTVLRICTSAFMIWLFLLFVCILVRIYVRRFDFLRAGLILALIILTVLGIGNVNGQIAEYNYNAYKQGKIKMDVEYMADIGDEGIPYLYKLTRDADSEIAGKAISALNDKYTEYYEIKVSKYKMFQNYSKHKKIYNSLGEYSIPKARAYKTLNKYAKENHDIIYK